MKNVLSFLTLLVTFLISGMLPTVGKTNPREKHGLQSQFSGQLFAYDIFSRWVNSKEINCDLDSLRRLTIVPTDTDLAALLPRSLFNTALASERITYSGISALYDSDIQVAAEVSANLETELALVNTASLLTGAGGITSRAISLGASRATVIYLTETGITMGAATAIISIGNESINQAVESGSMTENQATITRLGIQAASLYLTARAVKTPVPNSPAATKTAPSFFENATYTPKVLQQASRGAGEFHSFPAAVDAFESAGTVRSITGGDKVVRQVLEIPGSYTKPSSPGVPGKLYDGIFQYIKNPDGTINHRLFVPNP